MVAEAFARRQWQAMAGMRHVISHSKSTTGVEHRLCAKHFSGDAAAAAAAYFLANFNNSNANDGRMARIFVPKLPDEEGGSARRPEK